MTNDKQSLAERAGKIFSFPLFLGALLVAAVFLNLSLRLQHAEGLPSGQWHAAFVEGDTYWHMAAGERILKTHHWPTTNYYSFTTPDSEWLAYEWLGEVAMAAAARRGGPRALMALLFVLVSLMVLLVYYLGGITGQNPKTAFAATALVLPLLASCFSVRPQLFGYIFLLIALICLERYRGGEHANLWMLPCVFVLWVNTHGTFVLGLAALGIYWLAGVRNFRLGPFRGRAWLPRQHRHLAAVSALCLAALFVNPYGPRLLRYEYAITTQHVNLAYFEEWQPLAFKEFFGVWFLVLLVGIAIGLMVLGRPQRAEAIALVVLAACLACRHQRFIVFFAMAVAPVLAATLAAVSPPYAPDKNMPALNAGLIAVFAAAIIFFFPPAARLQQVIDRNQPRQALDYLRAHPVPGPLFNDDFWGGYLIWASHGERKVFIDGRSDAYEPSGVLADYIRIVQPSAGALKLLAKYGVRSCLIERSSALRDLLEAQPNWRRVYEDDLSVVYVQGSGT